MKNFKHIVASTLIVLVATTNASYAAVDTVSCETDPAFAANSCNQCFDG